MAKKIKKEIEQKLVNGIKMDYVSGSLLPFLKITSGSTQEIKDYNISDFKKLLKYSETKLKGYFLLSTLFNAYQEVKDGEMLKKENKMGHESVYADSGGLQVLTKGKEITDEIKDKVYRTQALYSDFAMTFDEMPLRIIEDQDQFAKCAVDNNRVVHIKELVGITAKNSANHIQKQIDIFEETETDCKILPIIHGFSESSYIEYANTIFENLHSIKHHIQGMAIASLSANADNKVGVMKVFDYVPTLMNAEEINPEYRQHVHLLGLASFQRIIPVVMMAKKGILKTVKRVSFDSTALTKAYTFGRVYANLEELADPRDYTPMLGLNNWQDPSSKNVRQFYGYVHSMFKDYEDYLFESVEDLMNHSQNNGSKLTFAEQCKANGTDFERKVLAQIRYSSLYSMVTYLSVLEAYIEDEITVSDIFHYNDALLYIFEMFENQAHTKDDFNEMCQFFYTKAGKGRTDMRYIIMDTIADFENSHFCKRDNAHPLDELGIGEAPKRDKDYVRPDLLARRAKRAKKHFDPDAEHPTESIF